MTCCNGNIIDLGCIYSCDLIQTARTADADGVYTLVTQPDGVKIVSNTLTAGDAIVFAGGYINEDAVTVFKVLKPNGDYLSVSGADCFQVKVTPTYATALANVDCVGVDCEDATVTVNSAAFGTVVSGGTLNVPVRNTEGTALGSLVAGVWTIPDTTYNVVIGGVTTQSFTLPTLKNENVNVYP